MITKYNFNHKKFSLINNSENGTVDSDTIFEYKQNGNLVTADYYGGLIRYGKIIAKLNEDNLDMLYQCLTINGDLKAGKATAMISLTANDKIKLKFEWEWLGEKNEKGISEYLEN